MTVIDSLRALPGAVTVQAERIADVFAFTECVTVLFFAGERDLGGEPTDVAVVLRELLQRQPRLRAGLMEAEDERKLKKLFGVSSTPALAFVHGHTTLALIERMKNWGVYERTAAEVVAAAWPVAEEIDP